MSLETIDITPTLRIKRLPAVPVSVKQLQEFKKCTCPYCPISGHWISIGEFTDGQPLRKKLRDKYGMSVAEAQRLVPPKPRPASSSPHRLFK